MQIGPFGLVRRSIKTLTVSKENGFIDGTNTVRVKVFQANTECLVRFF